MPVRSLRFEVYGDVEIEAVIQHSICILLVLARSERERGRERAREPFSRSRALPFARELFHSCSSLHPIALLPLPHRYTLPSLASLGRVGRRLRVDFAVSEGEEGRSKDGRGGEGEEKEKEKDKSVSASDEASYGKREANSLEVGRQDLLVSLGADRVWRAERSVSVCSSSKALVSINTLSPNSATHR